MVQWTSVFTIGITKMIPNSYIPPPSSGYSILFPNQLSWWTGQDSNLHARQRADLQSAEPTNCSTDPNLVIMLFCELWAARIIINHNNPRRYASVCNFTFLESGRGHDNSGNNYLVCWVSRIRTQDHSINSRELYR